MKILIVVHDECAISTILEAASRHADECVTVPGHQIDQYIVNKIEHGVRRIVFDESFGAIILDEMALKILKDKNFSFQEEDIYQYPIMLLVSDYDNLDMDFVRELRVSTMVKLPFSVSEFKAHLSIIVSKSQINHKISSWAFHDSLTGLFNRRMFINSLESYVNRYKTSHVPFTLALIDLDHFKLINDNHGHYAGDTVLQAFATIMRQKTRSSDFLARIGGEEFAIIFPDSNIKDTEQMLNRIRDELKNTPMIQDFLRVTYSAGIIQVDQTHDTSEKILAEADQLLYRAKDTGRNKICL